MSLFHRNTRDHWLPWELIRFLQFEIWPCSVIETQMSGACQWRKNAGRRGFRMEEKIMKHITDETRENLEKGTQDSSPPPKKNHWRTFPLPSIWCHICYAKAKVCGRSIAGIAVSNHAEGMMFVLLCLVQVPACARSWSLFSGVVPGECVCVWSRNLNSLVPIWVVVPQKIILFESCTIRYFVTRISFVTHNQAKCW